MENDFVLNVHKSDVGLIRVLVNRYDGSMWSNINNIERVSGTTRYKILDDDSEELVGDTELELSNGQFYVLKELFGLVWFG